MRPRDAHSPLADFIPAFLSPARGMAEKNRRDYERYLREFDDFCGRTSLAAAVTLANGRKFRDRLRERGLSAARNGTYVLRSFARWIAETHVLANPDGGSVLGQLTASRGPKTTREALDQQDLDRIWNALEARPERDRYRSISYVRLIYVTGMRKSIARSLRFKDVELDRNGRGGWLTLRTRSGRELERLRLDRQTAGALAAYLSDRPSYIGRQPEPLFVTRDGTAFSEYGFSTWIDRIGKDIEDATAIPWTSELMRHTFREESKAPFRDPELRSRCAHILNGRGNFDQAVFQACQVLETRIRDATDPPEAQRSGVALMKFAFGGEVPPLQLSSDKAEQRGALEMFVGLMSFYRNPGAHRVRTDLEKQEVLRIVGWIDQLLALAESASRVGARG